MIFKCKVRAEDGKLITDIIEAVDRVSASREIEKKRQTVISLAEAPYYGCGGWLKFFCVLLVFVGPILTLIRCILSYENIGSDRGYEGSSLILLENAGYFVISLFGLRTGFSLQKKEVRAVRAAKLYLVAIFTWALASIGIPFYGDYQGVTDNYLFVVAIEQSVSAALALVYVLIWAAYLSWSKRVRETFY